MRRQFVGLQYFTELLHDPFFFQTLRNTAVYLIVQVPLSIIFGLFAATLLNQRLPGWQLFRGIYFLPVVVPVVVLVHRLAVDAFEGHWRRSTMR